MDRPRQQYQGGDQYEYPLGNAQGARLQTFHELEPGRYRQQSSAEQETD